MAATATAAPSTFDRPRTNTFLRWAPVSGIVFVVLMVVGSMLIGDVPSPDASTKQVAAYLTDDGNHTRNLVGAYMWVVGALAFLWFLMRLRNDLRRAEGAPGVLSNLAFSAGIAFAAVWMVSAATFASVAYATGVRSAPVTSPDLVRVLPPMGRLILLLGGGFSGLLLLLATAALILRTAVYPKWLGWLAIVAAIVLLFDLVYLTIFPFWGWVFIASVVMLIRRDAAVVALDA
jgi:hypothetical protein